MLGNGDSAQNVALFVPWHGLGWTAMHSRSRRAQGERHFDVNKMFVLQLATLKKQSERHKYIKYQIEVIPGFTLRNTEMLHEKHIEAPCLPEYQRHFSPCKSWTRSAGLTREILEPKFSWLNATRCYLCPL